MVYKVIVNNTRRLLKPQHVVTHYETGDPKPTNKTNETSASLYSSVHMVQATERVNTNIVHTAGGTGCSWSIIIVFHSSFLVSWCPFYQSGGTARSWSITIVFHSSLLVSWCPLIYQSGDTAGSLAVQSFIHPFLVNIQSFIHSHIDIFIAFGRFFLDNKRMLSSHKLTHILIYLCCQKIFLRKKHILVHSSTYVEIFIAFRRDSFKTNTFQFNLSHKYGYNYIQLSEDIPSQQTHVQFNLPHNLYVDTFIDFRRYSFATNTFQFNLTHMLIYVQLSKDIPSQQTHFSSIY